MFSGRDVLPRVVLLKRKEYTNRKVFVSVLLTVFMLTALLSCGSGSSGDSNNNGNNKTVTIYTSGIGADNYACYWKGTTKTSLSTSLSGSIAKTIYVDSSGTVYTGGAPTVFTAGYWIGTTFTSLGGRRRWCRNICK